jgi:hypothetical protein
LQHQPQKKATIAPIAFFFFATLAIEEGDFNYNCRLLLFNTTTKENDGASPSSSSFQTQRRRQRH